MSVPVQPPSDTAVGHSQALTGLAANNTLAGRTIDFEPHGVSGKGGGGQERSANEQRSDSATSDRHGAGL